MIIKINGKEKTLEELERAEKLIKEAHDILWRLPSEINLEISDGNNYESLKRYKRGSTMLLDGSSDVLLARREATNK